MDHMWPPLMKEETERVSFRARENRKEIERLVVRKRERRGRGEGWLLEARRRPTVNWKEGSNRKKRMGEGREERGGIFQIATWQPSNGFSKFQKLP